LVNWKKLNNNQQHQSPLIRSIFKVGLFITLILAIFIPGILLFNRISYKVVEQSEIEKKILHAKRIIDHEIDEISLQSKKFANSKASVDFIVDHDPQFIANDLNEDLQKRMELNFVAIMDDNGEILYSNTIDLRGSKISKINFDVKSLILEYPEFRNLENKNDPGESGLIHFNNRLLLFSSQPIVSQQYPGKNNGYIIFGKFIDSSLNQQFSDLASFPVFIQSIDSKLTTSEMNLAKYVLTGIGAPPQKGLLDSLCIYCYQVNPGNMQFAISNPKVVLPFDKQLLGGYTILTDIKNEPAAILGIHIPKDIEEMEKKSTSDFIVAFLVIVSILGLVGIKILEGSIKNKEALDREYGLLRAVIDNVPEQIFAHDMEGRFILNNLRDAQMMGVMNPEELRGKNDFDYYPPELATEFQLSENQIIETGLAIVDKEAQIQRADGEFHWITTTKSPLYDKNGRIIGIVGVSREITDRKLRERELEAIVMMSRSLRIAETSTELLLMIYNQVIDKLEIDFGTLELIDQNNGDAIIYYSTGFQKSLDGLRIPSSIGLNRILRSTRKPFLDNNVIDNPEVLQEFSGCGCMAVAGAPMIVENELVGFVWIGRKTKISQYEVDLLAAMADIAASSIRRMALHELTEKRLNQISSLRKIDSSINSSKNMDVSLTVLLEETRSQLLVDAADVLLFKPNSELLENKIGLGFIDANIIKDMISVSDSPAGMVTLKRQFHYIKNLAELESSNDLAIAAKSEGFQSYCAVPLLVGKEIKGVLEVFFRREFVPEKDWIDYFETLAGQAAIAIEQVQLFEGLQQSNKDLILSYDETIEGWVRALDLRDKETEGHSLRVSQLCLELAIAMGIDDEALIQIRRGALLHDIGKVGVPDSILHKPGKLTEDEWIVMRGHPQFAYNMLSPIKYLEPALSIPYCHHERWDGTGYPRGIKGEEIPLEARIFSVIDVWDALSNDRPYRKAWKKEEAIKYIKNQAGTQFDPKVVAYFLAINPE
jgi:PAS domain S-box-containing protein